MKPITINTEYITLSQLLKMVNCVQSGGEAKFFLKTTHIQVNGENENRRGKKLVHSDIILIQGVGKFEIVNSQLHVK
jgi:ribosome-associated protein